MIIDNTPPPGKKWVARSEYHQCEFHKKNPGVNYAGCTCSGGFWNELVDVDPNEPQPKTCPTCQGSGSILS